MNIFKASYSIATDLPPVLDRVDDIECISGVTDAVWVVKGIVLGGLLRTVVGNVTGSTDGYEKMF